MEMAVWVLILFTLLMDSINWICSLNRIFRSAKGRTNNNKAPPQKDTASFSPYRCFQWQPLGDVEEINAPWILPHLQGPIPRTRLLPRPQPPLGLCFQKTLEAHFVSQATSYPGPCPTPPTHVHKTHEEEVPCRAIMYDLVRSNDS